MIAIVDSGGANIASVVNALDRLECPATLTADPDQIFKAERVLFPGVGAAGDSMERLRAKELTACLRELAQPVLGICLGMQLLFEASAEGEVSCLGILPGKVTRFDDQQGFPVPHMGWNTLRAVVDSPLLKGIDPREHFYFVHSYKAPEGAHVLASCDYGGEFPAVVGLKNYFGVQFHPEKSAGAGARLLRNFLAL